MRLMSSKARARARGRKVGDLSECYRGWGRLLALGSNEEEFGNAGSSV